MTLERAARAILCRRSLLRCGAVFEHACRDALCWPSSTLLAVNVSVVQLAWPPFVDTVLDVLHRVGLPPSRLELEVTESALAREPAAARAVLARLRQCPGLAPLEAKLSWAGTLRPQASSSWSCTTTNFSCNTF